LFGGLGVAILGSGAYAEVGSDAAETAEGSNFDYRTEVPAFSGSVWTGPEGSILFDNGPFTTCLGCGSGGADVSSLQDQSLGMTIYGFGHQLVADNRVADDFVVPAGQTWDIGSITFFAYQSFAGNVSTITSVSLQIWDGVPGDAGSNVIFGDETTNRMIGTSWTGVYRTLEGDITTSTDRAIMANVVSVNTTLGEGTYWLDWQTDGTATSGPWAPPVTILGQAATGNARQEQAGAPWVDLVDVEDSQGLPFIISTDGGVSPSCSDPVYAFDLEHCPLGDAVLAVEPDGSLSIDGIGASGEDGVSINLLSCQNCGTGYVAGFDYTWEAVTVDGSWLQVDGTDPGGATLCSSRMTDLPGDLMEASVGFSWAQAGDTVLVEALVDDVVVQSALLPVLPPVGGVIQLTAIVEFEDEVLPQIKKRPEGKNDRPDDWSRSKWKMSGPGGQRSVVFIGDLPGVEADEIAIEFAHSAGQAPWTRLVYTASNVSDLVVSDERVSREFSELDVSVTGSCPGPVTVTGFGATPNSGVAIIFASALGSDSLTGGPCAGSQTELMSPQFFNVVPTNSNGDFTLNSNAPANICGTFLQLVDANGCSLSPAVQIP